MNDRANPHATSDAGTPADAPPATAWHLLAPDAAARELASDAHRGLTTAEAARRLAQYGRNELHEQEGRGPLAMFLGQFTDFMILLLLVRRRDLGRASASSRTPIAILAIVVLNAIVGFVQEYRAEKALRALKQLAALKARVPARRRRSSRCPPPSWCRATSCCSRPARRPRRPAARSKPSQLKRRGGRADRRVASGREASSTPLADADGAARRPRQHGLQRHDRHLRPRPGASSSGTGMATELGKIATLLATTEEVRTPLQRRLAQLRQAAVRRRDRPVRARVHPRRAARRVDGADVPHRGEPRRRRGARGAARRHHDRARARRAADGEEERAHAPPAGGRDARLGHLHLLRQDRHADAEPACTPTRSSSTARSATRCRHGDDARARAVVVVRARARALQRRERRPRGRRWSATRPRSRSTPPRATRAATRRRSRRTMPRVAELPFDSERKCMTTLHRARRGRRRRRVHEGRAGAGARALRRPMLGHGGAQPIDAAPLLAQAERMARGGAARARDRARATGRRAGAPHPRGGRDRPHVRRLRRADRPAAARGRARGRRVPRGRHHAGDDHRRPSADRARDRRAPRHRRRGRRRSPDHRPRARAPRATAELVEQVPRPCASTRA